MAKAIKKAKKHLSQMKKEVLKQMLTLTTGGLGLIAALAWNEVITTLVSEYIKPFVGGSSEIFSLLIYAVLVTILAVVITYNLSWLVKRG